MTAELIEFSPAIAEWLGLRRARIILSSMTIGAVIFGETVTAVLCLGGAVVSGALMFALFSRSPAMAQV